MNKSARIAWRKQVKKLQRKKRRQRAAQERYFTDVSSPSFHTRLEQQELQEQLEREIEEKQRAECEQKWIEAEKEAIRKWEVEKLLREEQSEKKRLELERIREEWRKSQEKLQRKRDEEKRQQEEILRKQEEQNERIELFLRLGGEIPDVLQGNIETNPGKEICPFYSKVAACRFGPTCSRNHVIPGISRVLLIPNFYTHFVLSQNRPAEYDTDVGLEFEERDMHEDFVEFFYDVVSELNEFGRLRVVQVCRNAETHLRGNLYVEYSSERDALAAARKLHARWYGGRQISVKFALIPDWSTAICGDFFRSRCPKGRTCNFLHVFCNPRGLLRPQPRKKRIRTSLPTKETKQSSTVESERNWRWSSESPERSPPSPPRISRTRKRKRRKD